MRVKHKSQQGSLLKVTAVWLSSCSLSWMLYVRVSEIVAWEEEIDGLRGVGGSEWGAGAAALSWLWLTDYQITRVMNQDCRGLWSWHILTHTSTLTGTRQIHTLKNLYVNARTPQKHPDLQSQILIRKCVPVHSIHGQTRQRGQTLYMLHHLQPCCQQAVTEADICSSLQDVQTPPHTQERTCQITACSMQCTQQTQTKTAWTIVSRLWAVTSLLPHSFYFHTCTYMFIQHKCKTTISDMASPKSLSPRFCSTAGDGNPYTIIPSLS